MVLALSASTAAASTTLGSTCVLNFPAPAQTILFDPLTETVATAGVITKDIGGVAKEHKFIRADRHASYDDAVEFSLGKARQIVDQQGDRMFGPG